MTTNEIMVKMIFDRWNALIKSCDSILAAITDERLLQEVSPGKNRGIYLLGHLIAVHDDMLPILGLSEKSYPELFEIFLKAPDKSVAAIPSAGELRAIWKSQNETLAPRLASLSADQWFEKHNSVSAEDFAKEPHRNKLNIIVTRTTHLAYHNGQLMLLK